MVYESIGSSPVDWSGKPYHEIKEIAGQAGSILVVPVGSLEQHGPHMPTSTDTLLCDAVALGGSEKASDSVPVLVTPPIWTGFSRHHMEIGATVSIQISTLIQVLQEVGESALENGFDALLFLNGHGGNRDVITAMTKVVGSKHTDVDVLGLTYSRLAESFIDEIRESEIGGMRHAGEFETSLMLYLRPDLVDMESATDDNLKSRYELQSKDMMVRGPLASYGFAPATHSGVLGQASLGSAEKGEIIYKRLCDELADLINAIHEENV